MELSMEYKQNVIQEQLAMLLYKKLLLENNFMAVTKSLLLLTIDLQN
jgi:hypothetical protein